MGVLILVLMEDTLGEHLSKDAYKNVAVLILVLMEDTLGVYKDVKGCGKVQSLNPCFNGRYSRRICATHYESTVRSLNPCFNGRYSRRFKI